MLNQTSDLSDEASQVRTGQSSGQEGNPPVHLQVLDKLGPLKALS